jgi:hypothetical protein
MYPRCGRLMGPGDLGPPSSQTNTPQICRVFAPLRWAQIRLSDHGINSNRSSAIRIESEATITRTKTKTRELHHSICLPRVFRSHSA